MSAWREIKDGLFYRKARKRLDKVSEGQTHDWAMSTLWATQQGLEGFQVTRDPAALDEARRGAISLLAATDSLLGRLQ